MISLDNYKMLLISTTEEYATKYLKSKGIEYRITSKDNKLSITTRDFKANRINLEIIDNKVVKISVG